MAGPDGGPFTVRAATFVLATGGLENPRLLLASTARSAAGVGNDHDLVGRFYMDHARWPAARTPPAQPCLARTPRIARAVESRVPERQIETRLGVARITVVGHASDPTVTSRIGDWCRAAAGWSTARDLSVARFGDNMRYVAVTEGDKTEAEAVFGSQINTWGVMDLARLVEQATDAQIDDLIKEYIDLYDVVPILLPGAERHAPRGSPRAHLITLR